MKALRVEPEADEELASAVDWYEAQRAGLGAELMAAIVETVAKVQETPEAYPYVPGAPADLPARQAHVSRFPYRVVYFDLPELVHVLAFSHVRRRPFYWRHRA